MMRSDPVANDDARFRQVFERAPVGTALIGPDGRFIEVNRAFCEILGTEAERLLATTFADVVHPEDRASTWPLVAGGDCDADRPARGRGTRLLHAAGHVVWGELRISPVPGPNGATDYAIVHLLDVSEARRSEEALRHRVAIENLVATISSKFVHADSRLIDDTIREALRDIGRFTGAERSELFLFSADGTIQGASHAWLADGSEAFAGSLPDVLADAFVRIAGRIRALEVVQVPHVAKEGRDGVGGGRSLILVPAAHAGSAIGFMALESREASRAWSLEDVGILRVLAEILSSALVHARAEAALRTSEKRFREVLETLRLVAVILDHHGDIVFCNDFLLQLTGRSASEVAGKSWFEIFVPPDTRDNVRDVFLGIVRTGDLPPHYENPIVTRRGERRQILWNNTILRDASGTVIGTASIGEDITERTALEERLRESQKMEAVGRLAGGVAHDFNNQLTAINGLAELLLRALPESAPERRYAVEIVDAGDRAASLTRQLLAFSRRQVLRPRVLDLNAVVREGIGILRRVIGEDIDLVTALASAVGPVRADLVQIQQVILNLTVNARDAMPDGGNLTLETADVVVDEAFSRRRPDVRPGPYVMLAVRDTGCGMDPEILSLIFEPFFTTKEEGKGTGLGLATVYGIVRQSGGFLEVESTPGWGSTFRVYLPRASEPISVAPPDAPEPEMTGGSGTVLVVEDERQVRSLVREQLEVAGYDVYEAADGEEALRFCESHEGSIDLLLTDVVMPRLKGPDLATRVAVLRPGTKVLFISGYAESAKALLGTAGNEMGFLQKPFTRQQLLRKVAGLLKG